MSDQGPFIMSRYASRDHLHEAMRRRIVELQELLENYQLDSREVMSRSLHESRMAELEQENARLKTALERISREYWNEEAREALGAKETK